MREILYKNLKVIYLLKSLIFIYLFVFSFGRRRRRSRLVPPECVYDRLAAKIQVNDFLFLRMRMLQSWRDALRKNEAKAQVRDGVQLGLEVGGGDYCSPQGGRVSSGVGIGVPYRPLVDMCAQGPKVGGQGRGDAGDFCHRTVRESDSMLRVLESDDFSSIRHSSVTKQRVAHWRRLARSLDV